MENLCSRIQNFHLLANYRTSDESLKEFLGTIRTTQPEKPYLREFFASRLLSRSVQEAVTWSLHEGVSRGVRFTWLCVTHKGVERVNEAALMSLKDPISSERRAAEGYPGDPKVGAGGIVLRQGVRLRLSRNVDKTRGFVNGALCTIHRVLSKSVAVVQLFSGRLLLLHPIVEGEQTFLPCAYGYASTIRKAQGASLPAVILYFDHCHPPDRGYGYVGASRAQSRAGLYHYGRLRRTDWLPVGNAPGQQLRRGAESESDSDSESEDPYDSEDSDSDPFARLAQRYDEGDMGEGDEGDDADDAANVLSAFQDGEGIGDDSALL